MKSRSSEYQRQHDHDWPLSRAAGATGGSSSSSTGDEEHALGNLPRDGIIVSKEFGTDSTITNDGQRRVLDMRVLYYRLDFLAALFALLNVILAPLRVCDVALGLAMNH